LRAWERRYGLTPAERVGKTRFYSGQQVHRLTRIRRLIDQGHPISTLIDLSEAQLSERLQPPARAPARAPRVALVGTQLLMLEQTHSTPPQLEVDGRWVNLEAYQAQSATSTEHELLIVLLGSINATSLARLRSVLGDDKYSQSLLLLYHFATADGLEQAAEEGLTLLRWPIDWPQLEQTAARLTGRPLRASRHSLRRFSDEQLLSIAHAGAGLGCACPEHLVDFISQLNAFAEHSEACRDPNDVEAHAHARITELSFSARAQLELALGEWVETHELLPLAN